MTVTYADLTTDAGPAHTPTILHRLDEMRDTVGYIGNDFNPCWHVKWWYSREEIPQFEHDNLTVGYTTYAVSEGTVCYPADLQRVAVELSSLPDQVLEDFSVSAEHHFKTAVDDSHNILAIIVEAIELCEGNIDKLKKLGEAISQALAAFRKMYAKTHNYWLSWNFCIKPMYGDAKNVLLVIENAIKRLQWLQARNHLDTKVKYRWGQRSIEGSVLLPIEMATATPEYMGDFNGHPVYRDWGYARPTDDAYFRVDYTIDYTLTAWGWVRFDIPDFFLSNVVGFGVVWAALSGLLNPLKAVWEIVPFSWLIDWFVSLKTRLQIEAGNISPLKDAKILCTGHACKYRVHGLVVLHTSVKEYPAGGFSLKGFKRSPNLPKTEGSPFRIPWEWYNNSILIALLRQKHRRG